MGKVVKKVMGPVLGLFVGGTKGALQGLGNLATAYIGGPIAVALSIGSSLLAPKAKTPSASSATTDRLQVTINLRAPRVVVFGVTAAATDLRDQEYSTDGSLIHRFIVTASHKLNGYRQIWFDDKLAWTSSGGVQAPFIGYLTVTAINEGTAANAINIGTRMGSSRRFTGCAYVYFRYKVTGNDKKSESPFSSSIPSRLTIIAEGMPVYDPRLDSTRGGSGPQRAEDQTTWAWSEPAARNPALQALTYLIGWRIKNPATNALKLAVGKGLPLARINFASFITAANICDEPVALAVGGTEPRYRSDGIFNEGDELSLVLDNLKAACNANMDDAGGSWGITILYNDLATARQALTTDDVLGAFTWDQTQPLSTSVNVIRGGYTDPSTTSLYQLVDFPEERTASPDGIDRVQTFNLPMVQSKSQAKRLIKLRLQRAQFGGTFKADFQATAWRYEKNDVVPFTFSPLGFSAKLFRIAEMGIQVNGVVPMILREEHADIYLAADDANAAVVGTAPTTYNPLLQPILQDLSNLNGITDRQSSDGWLSGVEKPQARINYDALVNQRDALQTRYLALGSPSDVTPARNAAFDQVATLTAYLDGLAPAWDVVSAGDTVIPDAAAYRQQWDDVTNDLEEFAAAITGRPGTNGTNGLPGAPGANGQTSYVHFAYADSADGVTNFTAGAPGARSFVGVYTDFTAADSNSPAAYSWSRYRGIDGLNGSSGTPGAPGSNGQTSYIHLAYADSADGSVNFTTDDAAGRAYIGTLTDFTVADSGNYLAYTWSRFRGLDGSNGTPGAPGANGQTSYVHFAYADSADGSVNFTAAAAGDRQFVGTYTDFTEADSGNYLAYTWSRFRGLDGSNGTPGAPGANGQTTYVHIAYASSADGSSNFSISDPTGRAYIGTLTDFTLGDSGNYGDYVWSLIKGSDGSNGAPGADGITLDPSVVALTFLATYAGALKPGQINQTIQFKLADNLVDRSGSTAWSVQTSNAAATIDASGLVAFSDVADSGWVQATGVYGGKTYVKRVPIQKLKDPAPPQTSYSQSAPVNGSAVSNASYPSTPFPIVSIQPNSSGGLSALAALSWSIDNYGGGTKTWNAEVKAAYQLVGASTWSDFSSGPQTGGASVFTPQDRDGGGINATMTTSGLDPNKVYNIGLFLRVVGASAGTTAQLGGTFTARSA